MWAPFTYDAASLARNVQTPAMSSGWPMRLIGLTAAACSFWPSAHARVMSVSNAPGSTTLARTFGAHAPARPRVRAWSDALAKIGRAAGRERVGQYVEISGVAG